MFVVNRLNWYRTNSGFVRLPGEFRIASFQSVEKAHAEQQRLEADARALVNPFAGGCAPFEQSNMPEPILCDWLRDHDIEPPEADPETGRNWAIWWDAALAKWSTTQQFAAWEALDRVRFFEVIEEPDRPVMYAVAYADEHYAQAYYTHLSAVFQYRDEAEEDCSEQNEGVLEDEHGPEDDPDRKDPLAPFRAEDECSFEFEDRPFGNWPNGTPFCQVVPIEVEGSPKDQLFVVARRVSSLFSDNGCFSSPMEGDDAFSFVRGFSSKKAAETFCREKIQQAWESVMPGRVLINADPDELAEEIRKIGLLPPDPEKLKRQESLFGRWWATVGANATREQRVAVWELLSDVPLFVVFETDYVE